MVSSTKTGVSLKRTPREVAKHNNKIRARNILKKHDVEAPTKKQQQQQILDVFKSAFGETLSASTFSASVQAVKAALFARDFAAAFEGPLLPVYAARWSPTRALCYASVLKGIHEDHLYSLLQYQTAAKKTSVLSPTPPASASISGEGVKGGDGDAGALLEQLSLGSPGKGGQGQQEKGQGRQQQQQTSSDEVTTDEHEIDPALAPKEKVEEVEEKEDTRHSQTLKAVCIGGCAAEVVAFGSYLSASQGADTQVPLAGDLTLIDCAPWGEVVSSLVSHITQPSALAKYTTTTTSSKPIPRIFTDAMVPPSRLRAQFLERDVLTLGRADLSSVLGSSNNTPLLVTLLFTLNELFTSAGIGKTTTFLLDLTSTIPVGSLLLIVDSPGSYSETTIGAGKKENTPAAPAAADAPADPNAKKPRQYPMHWLMDRILMATRTEPVEGRRWKRLESHESVWFRVAAEFGGSGMDYPIALENMRFQMHLYRAEDATAVSTRGERQH
ncbi:hypothetical protein B0H63DRAFT_226473 [Podospora didyma]|uniref:25S rRNA (Uridine(2843)-N(3))-methyltransferase n=1 Tax=Podospora didyma TaxID=330526 RepID=A0AAE0NBY2_9PEZI|nr:hypothetical protein B0H63DRAFT_226473 [Podospora didyma]